MLALRVCDLSNWNSWESILSIWNENLDLLWVIHARMNFWSGTWLHMGANCKNSFTSTDLLFLSSTLTLFKSKGWRVEKKRSREKRKTSPFLWYQNISKQRRKSAFTVEKRKKQISNASFEKVVKTMRKMCLLLFQRTWQRGCVIPELSFTRHFGH